jgi:phosphoglycolate phosphatase-like HAD superfamily hydrolase
VNPKNYALRLMGRPALVIVLISVLGIVGQAQAGDPLTSWNDGPAKKAIIEFVAKATTEGSPEYSPPAERIAVFDNDGTLWVEQPMYTQVIFALQRVEALAPEHPEWKTEEPFKTILSGNREKMAHMTAQDLERVVAFTHSGMTVEEFHKILKDWFAVAKHPRYDRRYTELVYQPMLELMAYLRENGFKVYIVTGGGQEFVRVLAEEVYGVPPENAIGTAARTKYGHDKDGKPILTKLPEALWIDDKAGKPVGINLIIGRRPQAAFGNSDGDREMLEWTQAGNRAKLMMLVHHDDAEREYAYGPESKVGTFSDSLKTEAERQGWFIISMKNDWQRIFPFEK